LTQQEASVALAGGETDAFFTKTLPFTLTHDQAIEVSLEGLTTNASGKMWLDDFVLA
jgi:hypothetical protein